MALTKIYGAELSTLRTNWVENHRLQSTCSQTPHSFTDDRATLDGHNDRAQQQFDQPPRLLQYLSKRSRNPETPPIARSLQQQQLVAVARAAPQTDSSAETRKNDGRRYQGRGRNNHIHLHSHQRYESQLRHDGKHTSTTTSCTEQTTKQDGRPPGGALSLSLSGVLARF